MQYPGIRTTRQLGQVIRRARRKAEWTQDKLARRTGLRQAAISELERGVAGVHLDNLFRILAALQLDLLLEDRGGD